MTEKDRLIGILRRLNLPEGQWFLSGSGVMVMHDMAREMRDVDIFVSTRLWFRLLNQAHPVYRQYEDERMEWQVFTTDPTDERRRSDPPYLYAIIDGIEVNIFFSWRNRDTGNIDVNYWLANAEVVEGWPVMPLHFILYWKKEVGRSKDVPDIAAIERKLGMKAGAS